MTALEKLPARMDRFESQMRDEFSALRREMRLLHEDAIGRIALLGEGVGAQRQTTVSLAASLDESRAETRAMFDTVISRLTAIEKGLPPRRQTSR